MDWLMVDRRRVGPTWAALILFAIIAGSTGLSLYWAFLVPIYQSPDEPVHLDYALSLNEHRGLFRAETVPEGAPLEWGSHPYFDYFWERTKGRLVQFHPGNRVPEAYGTREWFADLDRDAPTVEADRITRAPALTGVYPFGYYVLLAFWLELVKAVRPGPVGLFFGARIFSVLLLQCTLLATFATVRELRLSRLTALTLTAVIGFFPLVSFISSYVQPDNLALTLVSLCYYLGLRVRRQPERDGLLGLLGLTLGGLLVTKVHFYLCVLLPTLIMLALPIWTERRTLAGRLKAVVLLALPSLFLGLIHCWVIGGTTNYHSGSAPYKGFDQTVMGGFTNALWNYFVGNTHESFWGMFGWMDTPLTLANHKVTSRVHYLVQTCTWIFMALALMRLQQVLSKLYVLARRGRAVSAWRLVVAHVPLNSYALFTALMFVLFIRSENRFCAQGRHWLPFLLPIFLTASHYAPRALALRQTQRVVSRLVLAGLLLYSLVAGYYSLRTIHNRYYSPPSDRQLWIPPDILPAQGGS
jgi:hypothetical protein